jgi:hypothetical protein
MHFRKKLNNAYCQVALFLLVVFTYHFTKLFDHLKKNDDDEDVVEGEV